MSYATLNYTGAELTQESNNELYANLAISIGSEWGIATNDGLNARCKMRKKQTENIHGTVRGLYLHTRTRTTREKGILQPSLLKKGDKIY